MRRGIEGLLVDLDNTIVPRDSEIISEDVHRWFAQLEVAGVSVFLLSNNWHERVSTIAKELGCPAAARALKPLRRGFRLAAKRLGARPGATAVVGDQLFTDVLGGNRFGALTVLVDPLSGSDLPHTVLLRRIEAWIMAGRTPDDTHLEREGPAE